jgi:hypothetical protein
MKRTHGKHLGFRDLSSVAGKKKHALAVWSFTLAFGAMAQQILAPPPLEFSQKAAVALPAGTNEAEMPQIVPIVPSNPDLPTWLNWGPVQLHPHLLYRFSYGDGIPVMPGQSAKTAINELSPGFLLVLGDHWRLDFAPTTRLYSSKLFQNTTDQAVALNGSTTYRNWDLGLSQNYASTTTPTIETASLTSQETYATAINATYHMSSAASLELGFGQNFLFFDQNVAGQNLSNSRTWSTMDWLNYQFSPGFSAGIGAGWGYSEEQASPDTMDEQLQARITWRPGEKLTLKLAGGFQDQQFLDSNVPDSITPIFSLSAIYQIFDPTTITLAASQTVSPSYFQSQSITSTTLIGGLRQRLFGRVFLDLSGGYSVGSYSGTTATAASNSEQDTSSLNARLTCPLLRGGTASVFYQGNWTSSSQPGFTYSSSQVGFELGYRF